MKNITLIEVTSNHPDFIFLCNELDNFLNIAIGGEQKREKYKKFNHLDTMDYVVVAYDKNIPVGCAALRKYSETEIEVKRVFVRQEYRGQNIGGMLLETLISQAKFLGYQRMLLETGEFLNDSVRLYARYGFEKIPNYGAYVNMSESLCMGLSITSDAIIYCRNRWLEPEDLQKLFHSVHWVSGNYSDKLSQAFKQAETVISAWHNDTLVGLVEVIDDGCVTAYMQYLLVHPNYQKQNIGSHLVQMAKDIYQEYLYFIVLCEKSDTVPFYEKLNFSVNDTVTPLHILNLG